MSGTSTKTVNDFSLEKGLPASPDAERSVLGGILLDNDLIREAKELSTDDFLLDAHRRIFRCMLELAEDNVPVIDQITLLETIKAKNEYDAVGGITYLASLTDRVPRKQSLMHYIHILREKTALRHVIHVANGLMAQAMDVGASPAEIIQAGQQALMKVAVAAAPATVRSMFVPASQFMREEDSTQVDWLIEGIIERGCNGFIAAPPKGSKSINSLDIAYCLAMGNPWLSFRVPNRIRTGVCTYEDNPSTTRRRLQKIAWSSFEEELDGYLWVSTKQHIERFKLDNPNDVRDLIVNCKELQLEFLILDVFNILHDKDENDNGDMRQVMDQCNIIHKEAGVDICILHHYNKQDGKSITERLRGSSAISGFAEWMIGLEVVDDERHIRKASFQVKGGEDPAPVYYHITNNEKGGITFEIVDFVEEKRQARSRRKKQGGLFTPEDEK